MIIGLSTRWNAGGHTDGEQMIEEILELGFTHVELGYDLRMDLVPGVLRMVREKAVRVVSVHNFCPVPVGAPKGHPELFSLASPDSRQRESAVQHIVRTVRFAAEVGAGVVIVHGGNVDMKRRSTELLALLELGQQFSPAYEKIKLRLQVAREKKVGRQLAHLNRGLERLLPVLTEAGVQLALENLPTWEAIPTEAEMEALLLKWNSPAIRYWHDVGHAQILQQLGFINQDRWLERLAPWMVGLHLHDVRPPAVDHIMPPGGLVDFARLRPFVQQEVLRVIEPAPRTPADRIRQGLQHLQQAWEPAATAGE